jgi:uncharacterized protein (TIGR03435 family)
MIKRVLLLSYLCLAISGVAQVQSSMRTMTFSVATIKPSVSRGWRLSPTDTGYVATGVTLLKMTHEAYGIYDLSRVAGGPSWIDSDKFDIVAKIDDVDLAGYRTSSIEQKHQMFLKLLEDRFKLVAHHQTKEFPVYELTVAKGGPKLQDETAVEAQDLEAKGIAGALVVQSRNGVFEVVGETAAGLAGYLSERLDVGRIVIDKTGLTGHYHLTLLTSSAPLTASTAIAGDDVGPSIFNALQNQLGLKLEPGTAMIDTIVIDSAEMPTPD